LQRTVIKAVNRKGCLCTFGVIGPIMAVAKQFKAEGLFFFPSSNRNRYSMMKPGLHMNWFKMKHKLTRDDLDPTSKTWVRTIEG